MTTSILILLYLSYDGSTQKHEIEFSVPLYGHSVTITFYAIYRRFYKHVHLFFIIRSLRAIYHLSNGHQQQAFEYISNKHSNTYNVSKSV